MELMKHSQVVDKAFCDVMEDYGTIYVGTPPSITDRISQV